MPGSKSHHHRGPGLGSLCRTPRRALWSEVLGPADMDLRSLVIDGTLHTLQCKSASLCSLSLCWAVKGSFRVLKMWVYFTAAQTYLRTLLSRSFSHKHFLYLVPTGDTVRHTTPCDRVHLPSVPFLVSITCLGRSQPLLPSTLFI